MQKKRIAIIFLAILVILSLIITGCGRTGTETTVMSPWFGGSMGVIASFESFGAEEIYEDETFPLVVLLENKGEFSVLDHEVEMELLGISPYDFSGIEFFMDNTDPLEKVSEFLPEGGFDRVNFGDARYDALSGRFYDANIFIQYSYPYATHIAVPQVCYKEDLHDPRLCEVESSKEAFASGAPIQIGTVWERPAGQGRIYLEIPIYNTGEGKAKAYLGDMFSNYYDEVAFEVNTNGWTCTAKGDPSVARIAKTDNEATIRCISDELPDDSLYLSQVDVTLSYYYQDLVGTVIRILENPELFGDPS